MGRHYLFLFDGCICLHGLISLCSLLHFHQGGTGHAEHAMNVYTHLHLHLRTLTWCLRRHFLNSELTWREWRDLVFWQVRDDKSNLLDCVMKNTVELFITVISFKLKWHHMVQQRKQDLSNRNSSHYTTLLASCFMWIIFQYFFTVFLTMCSCIMYQDKSCSAE